MFERWGMKISGWHLMDWREVCSVGECWLMAIFSASGFAYASRDGLWLIATAMLVLGGVALWMGLDRRARILESEYELDREIHRLSGTLSSKDLTIKRLDGRLERARGPSSPFTPPPPGCGERVIAPGIRNTPSSGAGFSKCAVCNADFYANCEKCGKPLCFAHSGLCPIDAGWDFVCSKEDGCH